MSEWYKVICGCEWWISAKSIHLSLISWRDCYLRKLDYLSQNSQNRRSGEKANRLFETYKNFVMPHGHHIYATAADMAMATLCAYPKPQHSLSYCKCVLRCCYNFPRIDLPDQESDRHNSNTPPSMRFNIYHLVAQCTVNGRRQIHKKKFVICVFNIRLLWHLVKYTPEKSLLWWRHILLISTQVSIFHKHRSSRFTFHK